MCAKCKKPARIEQRLVYGSEPALEIVAFCHGQREGMIITKSALEGTPGLHQQIDRGTGYAFEKAAAA